jgi:hypothetical protein
METHGDTVKTEYSQPKKLISLHSTSLKPQIGDSWLHDGPEDVCNTPQILKLRPIISFQVR